MAQAIPTKTATNSHHNVRFQKRYSPTKNSQIQDQKWNFFWDHAVFFLIMPYAKIKYQAIKYIIIDAEIQKRPIQTRISSWQNQKSEQIQIQWLTSKIISKHTHQIYDYLFCIKADWLLATITYTDKNFI